MIDPACNKYHIRALCPFFDFLAGIFRGSQKEASGSRLGFAGSQNSLPRLARALPISLDKQLCSNKKLKIHYQDNKIKYQRSLVKAKRSFTTRTKEHMRNVKHCTKGSNVAKHAWTFNHVIDFNNSKIIDKANNRSRKTLKSWHRAKTVGADNNSCLLPRQYHILLKKH